MREQTLQMLFHVVFLSQVLLVSFYLPRKILGLVQHVVEKYPPSRYPKLYPVSLDVAEKAQRNYWNLNLVVLAVGMALLLISVLSPTEEMLDWNTTLVLTIYLMVQLLPAMIFIWSNPGFTYFNLKRTADSTTTRRADLHRRRLVDFVSPTLLRTAIFVYLAFILFVAYVGQFKFPWFGGYLNVVILTAMNLFFLGLAMRQVYGKKKDPYQASEDRMRQLELLVSTLVLVSIGATLYGTLQIGLQALEWDALTGIATSLYYQLLAVVCLREFRVDGVNFEVYREDPMATALE